MSKPAPFRRTLSILIPCAVCLALNGFTVLQVGIHHPAYLRDPELQPNPDARHYFVLGDNIVTRGEFSRCEAPPYVPDPLRTPVYPFLVGVADGAAGPLGVFIVNILCQLGVVILTIYTTQRLGFSTLASLVSGTVVAADLSLAVLNLEAMSEQVYLLFSTSAIFMSMLLCLQPDSIAARRLILAGVLLALAILTRPAGLYLPGVLLAASFVRTLWTRDRRALGAMAMTSAVAVLLILPWIARNWMVFRLAKLSHADSINLVYFSAAGAYALARDCPLQEAQAEIAEQYGIVTLVQSNNPWTVDRAVADFDPELRRAGADVIRTYPVEWLQSIAIGMSKALLGHNVNVFATARGSSWNPPGLGNLLGGDWSEFIDRARENPAPLSLAFAYETLFAAVVLPLSVLGLARGLWRPRTRWFALFLLFVIAYYLATMAIVGLDAYTRHRSMLSPLFGCLLACLVDRAASQVD